mmetsp:Transcript_24016/g.42634  ORF Transcript_24016/g.42634 Transcript_24016/m.42634 type:complete len:96 (-) Transcript_24016:530-817(-)
MPLEPENLIWLVVEASENFTQNSANASACSVTQFPRSILSQTQNGWDLRREMSAVGDVGLVCSAILVVNDINVRIATAHHGMCVIRQGFSTGLSR